MRGIILPNSVIKPFPNGLLRAITADAPLALWTTDEAAGATSFADSIGNLDLAITGGVTAGEPSLWLNGKSASFDGVDGKAEASAIPVGLGSTLSIEMLIRTPDAATFDGYCGFLSIGDANESDGVHLSFWPPGGGTNAGYAINVGIPEDGADYQIDNVPRGTVCHLVITCSGTALKGYLNGVEVLSETLAGSLAAFSAMTQLGFSSVTGSNGACDLQYVAIYNTALSPTRVLVHSQKALKTYDQCARAIDERIAGLTANDTTKLIFSAMTHTGTPAYTRNASCWAHDLPIQCCSVWNSRGGVNGGGIAIAKDIVWMPYHYALGQVGDTMRFVTAGNTIVDKTIAATSRIGTTDIQLCRLSADLPDTIPVAKVLPDGWEAYFRRVTGDGNNNIGQRLPVIYTDQEKKALVADVDTLENSVGAMIIHATSNDAQRQTFYESVIAGDSGCPICLIVAGQVVPLTLFYSELWGPAITYNRAAVNSAITALGSAYQLTEVNLTGFGV